MLFIAYCNDQYRSLRTYPKQIKNFFQLKGEQPKLQLFQDISDLLRTLDSGVEFDAIFLDIDTREYSGIKLAKLIHKRYSCDYIIFISSRQELVFRSLQARPYRFIRKSHFLTDMPEAVESLIWDVKYQNDMVALSTGNNGLVRVNPCLVKYIESDNKNQVVVTTKETIKIRNTLAELEQTLQPYGFIRIHKGFLVNYDFVKQVHNNEIILDTDESLPLSRRRVKDVIASLEQMERHG